MKNLEHFSKDKMKKSTYVNSWYINNCESAAMWKCYAEKNDGIAIKSTVEKLKICLRDVNEQIYIGKITYIDYEDEIILQNNALFPYLHKRKSFECENELRMLYWNASVLNPNSDLQFPLGFNIKVDLEALIEAVFVSPTIPDWIQDLVRSILAKSGLTKEVHKSNLLDGGLW